MHLVPDGEEGDMGDDDDGHLFSDPLEICFEPPLLGVIDPSVVVAGL